MILVAGFLSMIVKAAHGVVEGGVDRGVQILGAASIRRAIGDKLCARDREVNADAVMTTVQLVPMRSFDCDVAREHAVARLE
jgi:hypothetical protein